MGGKKLLYACAMVVLFAPALSHADETAEPAAAPTEVALDAATVAEPHGATVAEPQVVAEAPALPPAAADAPPAQPADVILEAAREADAPAPIAQAPDSQREVPVTAAPAPAPRLAAATPDDLSNRGATPTDPPGLIVLERLVVPKDPVQGGTPAGGGVSVVQAAQPLPTANPDTLVGVYLLARANDPRYRAARLEAEAVEFGIDEARSGLLPVFAWDFNIGRIQQEILSSANQVFAFGKSTYASREQTFSLTQPIFRLAAIRRYQQAGAASKQAAATYAAAEQDLIQRTITSYLGVLAARDVLVFSQSERDAIRAQLDLADQRFQSGQATMVNLLDARARFATKEADVLSASNTYNDRAEALREITGMSIRTFGKLDTVPLVPPDPMDMQEWVDASIKRNLLLEARAQAVEVARLEVERQWAGHVPTLDLALRSNRQTTGGSLFGGGSDVRNNEAFLRFHVPIYSGGSVKALTSQAVRRYEASQEDLERDRRGIARQARAAYEAVTSGIVRVRALEDTRAALESARQLRVEGFKSGLTTMLAVLDAERDLYAVRRDIAQARYDYLLNMMKLKQAAGSLGDDDVVRTGSLVR